MRYLSWSPSSYVIQGQKTVFRQSHVIKMLVLSINFTCLGIYWVQILTKSQEVKKMGSIDFFLAELGQ